MGNPVPGHSDGYKPAIVPTSLKVIQGGGLQMDKSSLRSVEPTGSEPVKSAKNHTVFNRIGCLYLPVDDTEAISHWYKKHFNSTGTRDFALFWSATKEKGLTCNFMTDEWIPGELYEMFAVRFETDAIEELYARLSAADVKVEPLMDVGQKGLMFVYTDPQGNKFQVWQRPQTITQPLRDDVPAFIGVTDLFFPVSDPKATHQWYTEFLGVAVGESGQPVTSTGQEFHFYRSLEPGRTLNFYTGRGEIQDMSLVMLSVFGIDEMYRRMIDQGQKVQEKILDRGGCGRQFQLYDPDGNKLDIWDLQTMVGREQEGVGSSNWKERFYFSNCCFKHIDIDAFLTKVVNDEPGARHKTIQILEHADIRESDPEGLKQLIDTLEQFGRQHPEWAFEFIYREGRFEYN